MTYVVTVFVCRLILHVEAEYHFHLYTGLQIQKWSFFSKEASEAHIRDRSPSVRIHNGISYLMPYMNVRS